MCALTRLLTGVVVPTLASSHQQPQRGSMKRPHCTALISLALLSALTLSTTQAQTPAAVSGTDVYHVLFAKAAPGQAAALAKELQTVDPKDPMGSHFLLLRHQWGDDWDYCLVQDLGTEAA